MIFLFFIAGLVLLIVGAEALVRGASKLAVAVGTSPLVVGLTVVAFGTSAPEFAISIKSGLAGQGNLAVGNVVGSNIFNVLFILGLSALITPLVVSRQLVRFEVPLMAVVSGLILLWGTNGNFSRLEGIFLFSGLIAYIVFLIYLSRKESKAVQDEYAEEFAAEDDTVKSSPVKHYLVNFALVVGGLGLLVLGSRWLVDSAVTLAKYWGLSELIIGLTIIAAGTSLPEVVTSVIASIRGERDIAVGNVVGSSLFNLLGVLGLTSIITPGGLTVSEAAAGFDIPVMLAVSIACLPIFFTGLIARWHGALFLSYYVAYTLYLILGATQHDSLPFFSATMLYFVLPLTALTLFVVFVRTLKEQKRSVAP
jgi:cation:H+ antiporter